MYYYAVKANTEYKRDYKIGTAKKKAKTKPKAKKKKAKVTKREIIPRAKPSALKGRKSKPSQHKKVNTKWHGKFIKALMVHRGVNQAAEAIGVAPETAYNHRKRFSEFADQWAKAIESNINDLETAALSRAVDGWLEPVYQGGELVGHKRKFSNTLSIFMLKCRRPEPYFLESKIPSELPQESATQIRDFLHYLNNGGAFIPPAETDGKPEATESKGKTTGSDGN